MGIPARPDLFSIILNRLEGVREGMEKQRIGVLTSGGDAPGMNAAIRAVVRTASRQGMECVGIRRGWHGLINSDFVRLDTASVSHTIDKGGTLLYTARSEEFLSPSGREKALATCKLLGLDGLVAIGGDGTFRGALALSQMCIRDRGRGVGPLAQEPLRFDVPEPTGRPGQQLCLVIAPLAQPFGTDGNPGNGIKFAGEMLGGTLGDQRTQRFRRGADAMKLEPQQSLPRQILIP